MFLKLLRPWRGVPKGAIHPIQYQAGQPVPDELVAAARAAGVLDEADMPTPAKRPAARRKTPTRRKPAAKE